MSSSSSDREVSDVESSETDVEESQDVSKIVKCRTRKLLKLMAKLNETQKAAVRSIGFDGLFHVTFSHFPVNYVSHFLDAFNDGSYVFRASESKEFLVTKHDVHDCFMLPLGPVPLPKLATGRMKGARSDAVKEVKQRWRRLFNVSKSTGLIPIDRVEKAIMADTDGGDWFKQLFVLFSVSYFLCPTSNASVDMTLLSAVEDVQRINQFDWCTYVLDSLVSAASKKSKTRENLIGLRGCWPFLMITYFHRFDFRGQPAPSDIPLVKHWNHEKMLDRLKGELVGGKLGRQLWTSVKYPRCLDSSYRQDKVDTQPQPTPSEHVNEGPNKTGSRTKFIQIELPVGLDDDDDIRSKAVDDLHSLYLQIQRNAVAFHAWYLNAATRIKNLTTTLSNPLGFSATQSTQAFFEDPRLHKYVDDVVDAALLMKSKSSEAPLFEDASTSKVRDVLDDLQCANIGDDLEPPLQSNAPDTEERPPAHEVGSNGLSEKSNTDILPEDIEMLTDLYTTTEIEEAIHKRSPVQAAVDVGDPGRTVGQESENEPTKENVSERVYKRSRLSISEPHTPLVPADAISVKYSSIKSPSRGRGDGIGCSIECGRTNTKPLVVSNFMRANQSLFLGIPVLRQEVADYCFLDDWSMDPDEIVVDYGDNARLSRKDVLSLLPDRDTSPNVIDCWSRLLNRIEADESEVPRMAFLGIQHMEALSNLLDNGVLNTQTAHLKDELYRIWDNFVLDCGDAFYMDADLFFIPLLIHSHYAAVCINFKQKTIDILDNVKLTEPVQESQVKTYANIVAVDGASDYFEKWNLGKGGMIPNFNTRWIKFQWQTVDPNNFESGLFTMMHMAVYEGQEFNDENLRLKRNRRFLVVQLAAALLLADCNKVRDDLLLKVNNFTKDKPAMWIKIKDDRDLKKLVAKHAPAPK